MGAAEARVQTALGSGQFSIGEVRAQDLLRSASSEARGKEVSLRTRFERQVRAERTWAISGVSQVHSLF